MPLAPAQFRPRLRQLLEELVTGYVPVDDAIEDAYKRLAFTIMEREAQRKVCPECGATFYWINDVGNRPQIYCSTKCTGTASSRTRNHRMRTNGPSEHFTTRQIAERDGWKCHLCGKAVTQTDWSLDHLIPVSDGGTHTKANVSLAHLRCNVRRHTGGTVQLRLI